MKFITTIFFLCLSYSIAEATTLPCLSQDVPLWETPKATMKPIVNAINHAQREIDIVIYSFTNRTLLNALKKAHNRGVTVKILIEKSPYKAKTINQRALKFFKKNHIEVQFGNPAFYVTHQKTMLIDHQSAYLLTGNFTYTSFKKQRNFFIKLTQPDLLQQIAYVFNADWKRQPVKLKNNALVWEPNNKGRRIFKLIQQSQSSLNIYMPKIYNFTILRLLANKAKSGTNVKIILLPANNRHYLKDYQFLKQSGVHLRFMRRPTLHAKVIISDNKIVYLGSVNFTGTSLYKNRELGILLCNPNVIRKLQQSFKKDYHH